ncbi:MAG TPA: PHP domain-containing protein [Candidatus Aminicenantes bacterium]|nr:PHP domain-containing protein [Candidatus Aminicenantes bacterium]
MSGRVDLHVHSNKSGDGDFPPAELVGFAKDLGMRAISIADHDTVAAYPEAVELGRRAGVEVIPGIELTTLFGGREFHLLLPFVDWTSPALAAIVERQAAGRLTETSERVERLRALGFALTMDEVMARSQGAPPLGVKIAQILLDKPENEGHPGLESYYRPENRPYGPYLFYGDFFAEGKPAYVTKKFAALTDVLDAAPATGGAPVLAHPGAYFQRTTAEDARELKERGLLGMEVFTSYHTPEQTAFYRDLAGELDLVATAGSDFHGRIKPHVAFGALPHGDYAMVEALLARKGGSA